MLKFDMPPDTGNLRNNWFLWASLARLMEQQEQEGHPVVKFSSIPVSRRLATPV